MFWQKISKLVKKSLISCEIGIVLPNEYEIGKNCSFRLKQMPNRIDRILVILGND
ncbi:hypothetical protein BN193_01285 [Lactococcus raffinolactis 4877]|nr:hypothetical protein BN193_01285 [Lactococcus raffinolactis 4877]